MSAPNLKGTKRPPPDSEDTPDNKKVKLDTAGEAVIPVLQVMKKAEPTFLGIPRELRDTIYEYVIGGHQVSFGYGSIHAQAEGAFMPSREQWLDIVGMGLVCHQTRAETEILPYRLNEFYTVIDDGFVRFLSSLSKEKKDAIERVVLGQQWFYQLERRQQTQNVLEQLNDCAGLVSIIVRDTLSPDSQALIREFAINKGIEVVIKRSLLIATSGPTSEWEEEERAWEESFLEEEEGYGNDDDDDDDEEDEDEE
ncbi:hypothetical protein NX059_003823 [Plenodomus lindquistii]|nr:hypothetical protein NX059_003823 [Plenodomus lindquistii]